jgi:hypothetical protein
MRLLMSTMLAVALTVALSRSVTQYHANDSATTHMQFAQTDVKTRTLCRTMFAPSYKSLPGYTLKPSDVKTKRVVR